MLDDWDQRLVVSRLEKELDGRGLRLTQLAHRDQENGVEKSKSVLKKYIHFCVLHIFTMSLHDF